MCIQKRTFFAGVTVFFAGAAFLKTALICNFVANTIFIYYIMCSVMMLCAIMAKCLFLFFVSLTCLRLKNSPLNLRENLSKSISLLPLLLCSLCFERVVLFQLLFLLRLKNARSVENQTRIPHHSKQSKSIQNQLCVRVDIHTFLQIVL